MSPKSIHFRVINITLGFVLFLVLLSNLPHQSAPMMSWVNCALYFLIFLQCSSLVWRDKHNKALFFNIALLCLTYSLSFVNVFIGDNFLFGDNLLAIYVFQYRTLLLRFLLALCIVFVCVKYMFDGISTWKNYLISAGVILPIFLWHFFPFFQDANHLVSLPDYGDFDKSILSFTFFSFGSVCFYGYLLYRSEKPLGEHINSLMVCFFIMTLLDITDSVGYIFGIRLLSLSQYVLLIILSFFIVTLFRKLNYVYSEFGQFYEHLVISGNYLGVPIKRKKSPFAQSFLYFVRAYFHHRKNFIAFGVVSAVFCLNYFHVSTFLKINIATVSFATLVLSFYLSKLHEKRVNNGDLLAIRHRVERNKSRSPSHKFK